MTHHLLVAIAAIITLGIAAEWLAWRFHLPSILVLLIFGFIAGPLTRYLDPDAMLGSLLFPIVSISVAIILFEGGASLRLPELREVGGLVRNLVSLGALITWGLSAVAAYSILGLTVQTAALLGAILVVTGPTVIVPLLRHIRPVKQVASTLKWEGIVIDPIGAVLAVLVFEAVLAGELGAATTAAVLGLLKTMAIGAVLGALGAGLLVVLMERQWVPEFLQSPLALMVVVAAFAASNAFQPESGLLTATVMGVAVANQKAVEVKHILEFKENLRVLLISSLFILLAARLQLDDLRGFGLSEAAFLAALILVVRPVSVWLSSLGSGFKWRERVMIACVAPRGIVAAAVASLFALELAEAGYAGAERIVSVTFMVIIATVAIYGLGAAPLARLLKVAQTDPQGVLIVGAHPWARAIAAELRDERVPVRLVDTNYTNIAEARMMGLPVYYGSALTEGALDAIDLHGIGRVLALTANDEVNSLTALNFSEIFGSDGVYQLPPEQLSAKSGKGAVSRHLRGRFLFDTSANYWQLTARFDAGADVKTANLTETYDFQTFNARYRNAIPLFLIGEGGTLSVFTVNNPPKPGPGQKLIAVVDTMAESTAERQG
ncbi:MAG: sodium:proton antiporter [Gemmatimonadota bacterium]|nr:MAG: sodium:proton antiporter [Gemmatimonadota bacterium]